MKKIHYCNQIYDEVKKIKNNIKLEYLCKDKEFDYWLNVIKKSYGEYGEIIVEDVEDIKTKDEIRAETINTLLIDNKKKDLIISNLAKQINNLNIKTNKIEGDK